MLRQLGASFATVVVTIAALGGPPASADVPASRIDLDLAREHFALAERLSDADGGALWGEALYGPMLLVDPQTRELVSNVADEEGRLEPAGDGLFAGVLPPEVGVANTTTIWAGRRWTMLMWPLPRDEIGGGSLMMHECFHRIAPGMGLSLAAPDNHHLDSAEGRIWLRLEFRALAAALEADEPLASEAVGDALVFRRARHRLFKPAYKEERDFVQNEGLAEYTGWRLGGLDAPARRRRAAASLRSYDNAPRLTRTFAYAAGPAYAELLDLARPDWRDGIGPTTDLGRLLERAIDYKRPSRIPEMAARRAEVYGGEEVRAEEDGKAVARQARQNELRARFVDGPRLELPVVGEFNISFGPHTIEALDGVGTFYGHLRAAGKWGILDAPEGALIVEPRRGPHVIYVRAPDDPAVRPAAGPGWTLELAEGWTIEPGPRRGDYVLVEARDHADGPRVRPLAPRR
jgi:hypothetical protein